jgi:hypothetical protein
MSIKEIMILTGVEILERRKFVARDVDGNTVHFIIAGSGIWELQTRDRGTGLRGVDKCGGEGLAVTLRSSSAGISAMQRSDGRRLASGN